MMLVIDVSHWQPDITWPTLAEAGVGAAIIKATQGNYILDAKLEAHVAGAKSVGMAAGCYMWNDPLVSATAQADFFWNNVNLKPFDFLAIDVEQWWADWAKWSAWNRDRTRPLPPQLSAQRITESALTVLGILKGRTEKPVIMYTRATFMQQYAPALIAKTNTMQMWWAQWPYAGGRVITSWEAFLENWLPVATAPRFPNNWAGSRNWSFWQFSGDKFVLPGFGGDAAELDFFNGTKEQFQDWLVGITPPPPPPPFKPGLYTTLAWRSIRAGASINYVQVGYLPAGISAVYCAEVREVGNDWWGRLDDSGRAWTALRYNGVDYMAPVNLP